MTKKEINKEAKKYADKWWRGKYQEKEDLAKAFKKGIKFLLRSKK